MVRRWPVILTSVIDSVYSENHELTGLPEKADKLEEGKALIATVSRLKYAMARDRALEYVLSSSPFPDVYHPLREETPLIRFLQAHPSRR